MTFDPATGDPKPYPSHATQWRHYNGTLAWLFNPWTGDRRTAQDVGLDTFGYLIKVAGEPLVAAPETSNVEGFDANGSPVGELVELCSCNTPQTAFVDGLYVGVCQRCQKPV